MELLLAALLGISPVAAAEYGVHLDTDCSNEGRNRVLIHDNGAGAIWLPTNTATWCAPIGHTINPTVDPAFRSEGGE